MESQAGSGRVEYIDGLRAVAIAAVLLFHAGIWATSSGGSKVLGYGHLGVDLFFVVSGFCMVWPVLQRGETAVAPKGFWRRRFLRVALPFWPVLFAAIAASFFVYTLGGPSWWNQPQQDVFPITPSIVPDLVTHLALLHGFFLDYVHSIDGAFWSLSAEWQFYVVFPFLWLASRHWSLRTVAGTGLCISWGFAIAINRTHADVSDALLPWWLGTFCMGMLAAGVAHHQDRFRQPILIAGAGAALVALPLEWIKGPGYVLSRPLWAVAFSALVLASSEGPLRSALTVPAVRRLGLCSYSAYLIHGTVFMLMSVPMSRDAWPQSARIVSYFFVGIPLVVVLAWAYYQRVELPAHRLARRGPKPRSTDRLGGFQC